MVVFDFLEKIASTLFFRQLSGTKFPHTKNFVPLEYINQYKMEKGKNGIVMHQHAFY